VTDRARSGSTDADPERLPPAFLRLLTASGLSNLADGVLAVALPLVAIRLTRSPAAIAGLTVVATLPWLVFSLVAGALADRFDRRRMMALANLGRGLVAAVLVLTVARGSLDLATLYVVAFALGMIETLADTAAQTVLPRLVGPSQLTRANGRLYAVELGANQFVGPPLGGTLVALGAAVALASPALLWLLAGLILLRLPAIPSAARAPGATMRSDIAEGLRFLAGHRVLRRFAVMVGGFNFASSAAFAVFVLFAVGPGSTLGLSEPAFGALLTAAAFGSLAGSAVAARLERRLGPIRLITLTVPGSALLVMAPGLTTDVWLIGGAFAVGGVSVVAWNVVTVSLRQRITPDRLLGRVNSAYRLLAWGTRPLGALAGGALAELAGLRTVFLTMGVLALALVVLLIGLADEDLDPSSATA
jgi:MFS family permease